MESPHSIPATAARRVLLLGFGPLPSPGSRQAPGVANRLWHFAAPLIAAGHECLVITYEREGADCDTARLAAATAHEYQGRRWQQLPLHIEREAPPQNLFNLAREFKPERIISAGTLLPGSHAVLLAEALGVPCWVDLFGDPLAEIRAKAEVLGPAFNGDEQVMVWQMLLRVLARASAFSTVSRRQADALAGQLLLAGRDPLSHPAPHMTSIPCCVEALAPPNSAISRDALRARHGIPPGAVVALWSGGFNAWADPATLVRGIDQALTRDPNLWFVATGGGLTGFLEAVFEQFKALVAASPHAARILAPGWLPLAEAEAWLAASEIGLVIDRPCAETRFGARNRLLVHAAAQQPVIATRGCEAVADMAAAQALIEVPSGDPDALASELCALASEAARRARLGAAAHTFCAKHYTFAATTRELLNWAGEQARKPAPVNASIPLQYIQHAMDPDAHAQESRELQRLRQSPLHRFLGSLRSRPHP